MSRSIRTEIIINASKERVWELLTDFRHFPAWNPFMVSVEGEAVAGARLRNTVMNKGKAFVFKPMVLVSDAPNKLEWLGSLFVKGLFDGRHYFEIEEVSPGQVNLKHGEVFTGILSTQIFKKIGTDTRNNFIRMNNALKQLAEQG